MPWSAHLTDVSSQFLNGTQVPVGNNTPGGFHPFLPAVKSRFGFTQEDEMMLRYMVVCSAALSFVGSFAIVASATKFHNVMRHFFAIRLVFFLSITDALSSIICMMGIFVSVHALWTPSGWKSFACEMQAAGLLYLNLASILWTSCFAFTLYRDCVASHSSWTTHYSRNQTLKRLEPFFHFLCWPIPAAVVSVCYSMGLLGDSGSWCAVKYDYTFFYLMCFYLPLMLAFVFNLVIYTLVWSYGELPGAGHKATSPYLLVFAVVWFPSLTLRLVYWTKLGGYKEIYWLACIESICMPLQGFLNALVYGWSMPIIRDRCKESFLGYDSLDVADEGNSNSSRGSPAPTQFYQQPSPPAWTHQALSQPHVQNN